MSSIDQQQIADTAADTDAASSPSAEVMDPLLRSATDDEDSSADARAPPGAQAPDETASTSADTRCSSTSTDDPSPADARSPDEAITSSVDIEYPSTTTDETSPVDTNSADATVAPSTGTGCPSTAPASASPKISKDKVLKPLFRIASEKLYELFMETGLSRQECKTLWHEVYDRILDRKRVLYFSKESTADEKALCREEIVQSMMIAVKTWSSTTCRWSDQLVLDDDKIASFIIEQKIKGLVDHAVTCFQISLDTLIKTGSQWFWLYQDEVTDPPQDWQNFLDIKGVAIEYR